MQTDKNIMQTDKNIMQTDKNILQKYLKYKQKYTNLKKIMTGGEIKYICPQDKPHKCDLSTKNFGLCTMTGKEEICNDDEYMMEHTTIPIPQLDLLTEEDTIEIDENKARGDEKHYTETTLNKSCYIQQSRPFIKEYTYTGLINSINVPNVFSIITLNAMGIYLVDNEAQLTLMKLRINMLIHYLLNTEEQPDILCFQEMSATFFNLLYEGIKHVYPYYYEDEFTTMKILDRKHDVEVFLITKYPVKKIAIYPLEGNLNYNDSLGVFEFNNLIVINAYLQAGSRKSPGQKYKWEHYSRCRSQQLRFINLLIKSFDKPIVLLGDFNFDLNNQNMEEWPEVKYFNEIGFTDSWQSLNHHLDPRLGLTENTEQNTMRFNSKLEEKMFRYDAILSNHKLTPIKSQVICNQPLTLDDQIPRKILIGINPDTNYIKLNEYYKSVIIPKTITPDLVDKIIVRKQIHGKNIYDLFISDHFGVFSQFCIN